MEQKIRKAISFIANTGQPWVARNLPPELARPIKSSLFEIKEVCNEWLDKRGIFKNDKN